MIGVNGKSVVVGLFDSELDASNAYWLALSKIKDGSFNPDDYKPKWTSKYNGVSFSQRDKKWQARITINGERKFLGYFPSEFEAYHACLKARK